MTTITSLSHHTICRRGSAQDARSSTSRKHTSATRVSGLAPTPGCVDCAQTCTTSTCGSAPTARCCAAYDATIITILTLSNVLFVMDTCNWIKAYYTDGGTSTKQDTYISCNISVLACGSLLMTIICQLNDNMISNRPITKSVKVNLK